MLYAVIEAESADLAQRQSLRWMWNELEYGGSYLGDVPEGGYRRLTEAMASGVDVRLGVEVTEVATSAGGVRVRGADGWSEEGSHAVVTVPPIPTPAGPIPISPPGPARPTPICWASRSADVCCSRESTLRAPGWPTPTAR